MLRKIRFSLPFKHAGLLKELSLCFLSAVLLSLSFPNTNFEFLAWFGLVPLFLITKKQSTSKAFLFFYLTGVIFWSVIIYWLIHVTLPGLVLLVLYLAFYFGLFGAIFSISSRLLPSSAYSLLFIPSLWIILEYLRSRLFTGFGWALLGYSQYLNLPLIQIADITGIWGISFLLVMVNVFIYLVIDNRRWSIREMKSYPVALLCLILAFGYGFYKLHQAPEDGQRKALKISVIQGNISQELKWQKYSQNLILDEYTRLSEKASLDKPDLIIWPEAAAPGFLFDKDDNWIYQSIFNLAKELKTNLLIGTVVKVRSDYYNSAALISAQGNIVKRYDKIHLVPFGEYIPLKRMFGFLQTVVPIGDFLSGRDRAVFSLDNQTAEKSEEQAKFSVLICFEDLFPDLSREFVRRGASLLVNITNDAWFGKTSSPFQHLGLSVLRAVENRRPLVRAANTGVSCFIDSNGAIKSLIQDEYGRPIFIRKHKTETVYPDNSITFYTRYGDIFVLLCFILVICGIIIYYLKYSAFKAVIFRK